MDSELQSELTAFLEQFVSENKRQKIQDVLAQRTRYVTIVLEDIYQPQNASATLRTSECQGLQDIYIVENRNPYKVNRDVALGASKWLNLHRFNEEVRFNTSDCLAELRRRGFRLVATTPDPDSRELSQVPLDQKLAFMFGTEESGLTAEALAAADLRVRLPMFGFTQSYNISVSVAMTLAEIMPRLRASDLPWQLTQTEKDILVLDWYRQIVDRSDIIERNFLRQRGVSDV